MYREIVDWQTSKISAQTSSVMLLRAYPQATVSASRKVSSRGRPFPLSHGSSSSSSTHSSSSSSCSAFNPDIRSNRTGFPVVRFGVVTSLLSAGEAVAYYLLRHVVGFLDIPDSDTQTSYYGVLHKPHGASLRRHRL